MTLKNFLKFVEIQTKVASMVPFILGTLYAVYRYKDFHIINFVIMFVSLLTFDMATTAINNYMDYKKASRAEGDKKSSSNIIASGQIKKSHAIVIIFMLLVIATAFGITLTIKTNVIVLLIGILSFIVGILYTFGPIPISRMPLGEIFSGFFMGFIILFLSVYIQGYDKNTITLAFNSGILSMNLNIYECVSILLISIPVMGGIANIMLANNICDVEEDIINMRFTLPYYLGRENSLTLFKSLYYIGYIDICVLVILRLLPPAMLIALITFIPVNKSIKLFYKTQKKSQTFIYSVKNFIIMNVTQIIILGLVVLFTNI